MASRLKEIIIPLFETGEDLPGMLGLVLGLPLYEGCQETEAGPAKTSWDG